MQEFRLMSVGDYNAKALLYDFLNTHRPTLHSCPRQSKVPPFASSRGEALVTDFPSWKQFRSGRVSSPSSGSIDRTTDDIPDTNPRCCYSHWSRQAFSTPQQERLSTITLKERTRPMESGVKEVKKLDKIVDHRSSLALLSVLFEVLDLRAHPSHHLTRQLRRVTSEQASFVHAPAGEVVERFSEEQGKNTAMGKQP
mmetsp:Transcript_19823/g.46472  ORF Transcript_19823/g.46472 Transcript_19823/m.46472 type:complete len:197 (-) Transcript_19823:389-979(-)